MNWIVKIIKALVLAVVAMASASVLVFAIAAVLAMAAVCLLALLTAYVVSPSDVKTVISALTAKFDGWMKDLTGLVQSMVGVIRSATEAAKTAAGIPAQEAPQEKAPAPEAPATEAPAAAEEPEAEAPAEKPARRRRHWSSARRKPRAAAGEAPQQDAPKSEG